MSCSPSPVVWWLSHFIFLKWNNNLILDIQILKDEGGIFLRNLGSRLITTLYRGADKSLARRGRKQARKHVRKARDFNNIETRAVIKFPPHPTPLKDKAPKEIHVILTETLACLFPGRAKDLSAPPYHMPEERNCQLYSRVKLKTGVHFILLCQFNVKIMIRRIKCVCDSSNLKIGRESIVKERHIYRLMLQRLDHFVKRIKITLSNEKVGHGASHTARDIWVSHSGVAEDSSHLFQNNGIFRNVRSVGPTTQRHVQKDFKHFQLRTDS